MLLSAPVFALPTANELSTEELVGQAIMPRLTIGHHQVFKGPIQRGEVTGFYIKTDVGHTTAVDVNLKNQDKILKKQRKILIKSLKDVKKWAAKSQHKIPLFLAFDYEGGTVTSPMFLGLKQMPSNMLLAATGNKELITEMYAQQAAEIKRVGGNMALGPVTDVNSNPANPIIQTRSFGDNSKQVGEFATAAVKGLQQNGVPAVLKHFPGHGDTSVDSHFTQPVTNLPEKQLWNTHISAFQAPIDAGVVGVMNNHVVYPQVDDKNSSIFSRKITHDILRDKMGFKGLVLTDGLDMGGNKDRTLKEAILDGMVSGNDIFLFGGDFLNQLEETAAAPAKAAKWVKADLQSTRPMLSIGSLQSNAQRILEVKKNLSQEGPKFFENDKDFAKTARKVAEAGVTLVRDEQGFIADFQQVQNVCVFMFADGIFSKQVNTLAEVLKANGKNVTYVQTPRKPSETAQRDMKACGANAQAIIVGTSSTSSLNTDQHELVKALFANAEKAGKPVAMISLLNPYEIPAYPEANTILAVYGPTVETMAVSAEILLGKLPAKGTLPVKLPAENKLPIEKTTRVNFL